MLSDEEPIGEEFVLKWRIEDFNMCPFQNKEFVKSPVITLKSFNNTAWYLKVRPRDVRQEDGENTIEHISCYLRRAETDDGPESISVSFKLSVNSVEKEFRMKTFVNGKGSGAKFLRRESRLHCCTLLDIECYMNFCSTDEENSFESSSSSLTEETETKPFPSTQESQGSSVISNRCFILSKISIENRSYIFPKKGIYPRLSTLSFMEDHNLTTTWHLKNNSEDNKQYLEVDFCFEGELNENLFLVCCIQILDSNGKICMSTEDEYLFSKENRNEVWHFAKPFLANEVKGKGRLWYIKFSASDGQIRSNLEWLVKDSYSAEDNLARYLPKFFLKEIFHFYKDNKDCDVTLRIKDKEFHCHKTVLSTQSSKFASIFKSGVKNYPSNIIPIEDLKDSEIVRQMIDFMYTSKVENWECDTAISLFFAAEKYEIDSLKSKCCDFIKSSINCENVCSVLNFSHIVKDDKLKQSAIKFISDNKNEILHSSQWEKLIESNKHFAYEVLKTAATYDALPLAQGTENNSSN